MPRQLNAPADKAPCEVSAPAEAAVGGALPWQCKARIASGANDPQDCNWPLCGCDPYADKVIGALNVSGLYIVPCTPTKEMIAAVRDDEKNFVGIRPLDDDRYEDIYIAMVERGQKS
jgi:hypothetical protein